MKKNVLFTILLSLHFIGYSQTIIYVRSGATGSGSSWADACDLLAGADKAKVEALSGRRSEIWVKSGIYYPSKTVKIADMVKVYGGFLGNETRLSERNYAQNVTTIDGQRNFGVIHLGMHTLLNGFTIQNGSAHIAGRRSGGGIWMMDYAHVENCYVLNNQALDNGGGIYGEGDGVVLNTVLAKNKASLDGVAVYGSSLDLRNNTVTDNALMTVTPLTDVTPFSVCSGSRATLRVVDAGSYRWSSGETTAQITTPALAASTTYTVTVMPLDKSSVFELKFEIGVKPLPLLSISTSHAMANVGDSVVFDAQASPAGGHYRWDDVQSSTAASIKQVMQATGDLTRTCTYTLDGCEAQSSATVINNRCTPPTAPSALSAVKSALCVGDSVELELYGGDRNSGTWFLYSGSCGGTRVDSSKATSVRFWVKPSSSSTYYVRGEGCGEQTACVSTTITVNPLPSEITGDDSTCQHVEVQLSSLTLGGTWQADALGMTDVSADGLVTTRTPGIAILRYTLPTTGCYREHELTIFPAPEYIHGLDGFCAGTMATYAAGPVPGGRFRVEPTTYATMDGVTGELSTLKIIPADQTVKVYYAEPSHGCETFKEVNIFRTPMPIVGMRAVCAGDTLVLTNATTPAGVWNSGNPLMGYFTSPTSGHFVANSAGKVVVSYDLGDCKDTFALQVNARPAIPSINKKLCEGATVPVSSSPGGGRWSVSPSTLVTVDSAGPMLGVLTGISKGRFTLTYTLPTGCSSTRLDSIYLSPTPIVGDSLLGLHLEDTLRTSPFGGYWESLNNAIINIQSSPSFALIEAVGVGTATVTYKLSAAECSQSKVIRVAPCATITAPVGNFNQQTVCLQNNISPIHYTLVNATKVALTWTDENGHAIAHPAGIVLDTTTVRGKVSLSGSIATSGIYHYKLATVDHFGGCPSGATAEGWIKIYSELQGGKIGRNQHICQGTTPAAFISLNVPTGGAPGGTYLWQRQAFSSTSWNDLANSNTPAFDDLSLITESHRYRRQYTNACGIVYSDTALVKIDSLPLVTVVKIDSNTSCTGGNGKITLTLKNPTDVEMSIDQITYQPSPIFENLAAGTYTIFLRNSQTTCRSERKVEVKTSYKNVPRLVITGKDSICAGDSTLWKVVVLNHDVSLYQYQWSQTGNPNFSQADSVRLKGPAGSIEVVVRHVSTSCEARLSRGLAVMPPIDITEFSYFGQGDTTLCENEELIFKVKATSSGLTRTYAWYRAEDATFMVNPELVSTSSEFTYKPATARTRYYRAVVSSPFAICPSKTSPVIKVTALPRPKPAISGPSASCTGDEITLSVANQAGWTYRWILGADTLSTTHQLMIRPNADNSLFQLLAHNGYCSDVSSHTVALRLRPTFGYADAQSGIVIQSICHNGPMQEIRAKVEHATGLVLVWDGTPLNSLQFDGTAMTFSGTVSEAPGTYPFHCYTTGHAAECPVATASGVFTILEPVSAGSVTVPSFICHNSVPGQFTNLVAASGGASGGSYQWRQSTDGNVWNDIVGATDQSIQINTPLTQTTHYRRMYKNLCGDVYTTPQELVVRPLPTTPTFSVVDNTNCFGGSNGSITVTAPTGLNFEYSLQSQVGYNSSSTFPSLAEGLYRVYVRDVSSTCQNSDTARVKNAGINNIPEFSIVTNLPNGTDSVCASNPSLVLSAQEVANCAGAVYSWWKSTDPSNILSTSNSLSLTTPQDGDVYHLQIKNSGNCDATSARRITVVSPLSITTQPQGDTLCGQISTATFTIGIGNVQGRLLKYQWQRKATTSGVSWEDVGSNSNSFTTAQYNKDTTFYYQCVVQLQNSAICPALTSQTVHLKMLSTPAPKISGDTVICGGFPTTLSVPNIYKSYVWMLNGNIIQGETSSSLTTVPLAVAQEYRIRVSNGYCEGMSLVSVKAHKGATISVPIPAEQNLCYQTSFTRRIIVQQATGLEALSWKRDGNAISQPTGVTFTKIYQGTNVVGTDSCVYELSGTFDVEGSYSYDMKSTGHPSACSAATRTGTLIAYGSLQGGEIETASNIVCYNTLAQPFTNKVPASGGYGTIGDGTTKYQWYSTASGSMDAISGATSLSYNPTGAAEYLTSERSYQRKFTNHCGTVSSNILTISVKSLDAAPTLVIEDQTSCSATPNGKITVTLPSGNDYEFSKDGGATFQASPVFEQLSPVNGLQIVARHKGSGCRTLATVANILNKVDDKRPRFTFAFYPNDTVCADASGVGIKALVTDGGSHPQFEWSPVAAPADSISVAIPSGITAEQAIEYSLKVTNTQTTCTSLAGPTAKVHVFPPVKIQQQPQGGKVCINATTNRTLSVSVVSIGLPRKYQWQRSATINGPYADIPAGGQGASYLVPTDVLSDFWYRCVISGGYGICGAVVSDAVRFEVVAAPTAPVISPADHYICDGSLTTLAASGYDAGNTLKWSANAGGATTPSVKVSPSAVVGIVGAPTYYTVSASNGACETTSAQAVVRVSRKHHMNHVGDQNLLLHAQEVCGGGAISTIEHNATGGASGWSAIRWSAPNGSTAQPTWIAVTTNDNTQSISGTTPTAVSDTGVYRWETYTVGVSTNICPADTLRGTILVGLVPTQTLIYGEIAGNSAACSDTLLVASGGVGGTIYFQGKVSGDTSTLIPTTSQQVTSSGTYYFRAQSVHGCWSLQGQRTVTIYAAPSVGLHPSTVDQTLTLASHSFPTLKVTGIGNALRYQWYRNDQPTNSGGIPVPSGTGGNTANYTPDKNVVGPYWYYCVISNECGVATAVSGKHWVKCTMPRLTLTSDESTRHQVVEYYNCVGIEPIKHTATSAANYSLTWEGPKGTNAPLGFTSLTWNNISGRCYVSVADTGTYTWTIIASNLACADTSKGTIVFNAGPWKPTIAPNTDTTIDGKIYVADYQGRVYNAVRIGNQVWMAENLRVNASPKGIAWIHGGNFSTPPSYYAANLCYGNFYNWRAAMDYTKDEPAVTPTGNHQGICPFGWHIPTDEEWTVLEKALGSPATPLTGARGTIASQLALRSLLWAPSTATNAPGNLNNANQNSTSFSATPAGVFDEGYARNITQNAYYWSTTLSGGLVLLRRLDYNSAGVVRVTNAGSYGFNVRCVKDSLYFVTQPSTADRSISSGNFSALTVKAMGTEPLTYQWFSNTNSDTTTGIALLGATAASYTPSNLVIGPVYYYCKVSDRSGTIVSNLSGAHTVICTDPVLKVEGSLDQSVVRNSCENVQTITHAITGPGALETIVWSGPNGGTTAIAGITATANKISGLPSSVAELGVYTWTVTARNLSCTVISTGTIQILTDSKPEVMLPDSEMINDGILFVSDHEANIYKTVKIGNQTWMAENMRCTTSPTNVARWNRVTGNNTFDRDYSPFYYDIGDACYGVLYSWAAVMNIPEGNLNLNITTQKYKGICPAGWHVPTDEEWTTLEKSLGSPATPDMYYRGNIASKLAARTSLWTASTQENAPGGYAKNANQNSSGFSATPAGVYDNGYLNRGIECYFWSVLQARSDLAFDRYLNYNNAGVHRYYNLKSYGFSLRCIRD